MLFTAQTSATGGDGANVEVMTLADHRRKTLQRRGAFGRYLRASQGTGHLVYINKGTLFAMPLDPDTLGVRGTPSPAEFVGSQSNLDRLLDKPWIVGNPDLLLSGPY